MPTKKKLYTDTRFAICSQRRWNAQAKGAKEAEALVAKEVEQLDGSTSINTNTELEFWEDPNAPKFETPEEMMYRMRLAKKSKRTEKRRIARERKAAPMRNALMEKLTQKPVVIHGMVDEYGNYGGNPEIDIVMPDISIDLGGIVLFEDAQLTLVYGRRYGLIGRNGSGTVHALLLNVLYVNFHNNTNTNISRTVTRLFAILGMFGPSFVTFFRQFLLLLLLFLCTFSLNILKKNLFFFLFSYLTFFKR